MLKQLTEMLITLIKVITNFEPDNLVLLLTATLHYLSKAQRKLLKAVYLPISNNYS